MEPGSRTRSSRPSLRTWAARLSARGPSPQMVQRPAGDLLVDAPERVDDVLELLLRGEPAGGDEGLLVERASGPAGGPGSGFGIDQELGSGAAEAAGQPARHRLGQRHHDVGARGELEQRAEVVDPARGRAVLLVHERHVGRRELGDDGQQLGGRGDEDVGLDAAERLAHGGVGEAVVEGVPAARHDHRLAVGELGRVAAGDRGRPLTAYVDEVGDLEPVGERVVGRRAAARDAEDPDPVALAEPEEGVGLLDAGAGGAAHPVGVEEDEDDVERAVAARRGAPPSAPSPRACRSVPRVPQSCLCGGVAERVATILEAGASGR